MFLLALSEQANDFPALKSAPAESSADTLAREIERQVHEDVLASFRGRPPDSTAKLAKLTFLGLLVLGLLVAAVAAILLLVRALV